MWGSLARVGGWERAHGFGSLTGILEEWSGVPSSAIELDEDARRYLEGLHVVRGRLLHVRRRDRNVPRLTLRAAEALRALGVMHDVVEGHAPPLKAHDVEARNALIQHELRVIRIEVLPVTLRRDHLVGRD